MTAVKKKPKLTKKMLGNLDRAELRVVLIQGMSMKPELAYQKDNKWCVSYIYDNQLAFAEADLSEIHPGERFRPTVFSYVTSLQKYLAGDIAAPNWPPEDVAQEEVAPVGVTKAAPAEVKEEVSSPTPVVVEKFTQLVPPSTYLENDFSQSKAEASPSTSPKKLLRYLRTQAPGSLPSKAPINTGSPFPTTKIAFSKVDGIGSGGQSVEDDTALQITSAYFDESLDYLFEHVDKTKVEVIKSLEGVTAHLESRISNIENALLFVINSAILPKGSIVETLDDIPKPPYS
jgi:hypothetical protein